MAPPTLRIARPTNDLSALSKFYIDGLGLSPLSSFEDHASFDGIILGHADYQWHLEFTHQHGVVVERAPSKENLLVFYEPDKKLWEEAVKKLQEAGGVRVQSENPYWAKVGATFEDPDGWRVVLQNTSWPVRDGEMG